MVPGTEANASWGLVGVITDVRDGTKARWVDQQGSETRETRETMETRETRETINGRE